MSGVVYLLHLDAPLGNPANPRAQAQHYLGWAHNLEARLAQHRAGQGAALTRAAVARGIGFQVVATWPGERTDERAFKRLKAAARLCPICGRIHRRGPLVLAYHQLALPLDEPEPWPTLPPHTSYDRYEAAYLASVRRAVRAPAQVITAADGDIPW